MRRQNDLATIEKQAAAIEPTRLGCQASASFGCAYYGDGFQLWCPERCGETLTKCGKRYGERTFLGLPLAG